MTRWGKDCWESESNLIKKQNLEGKKSQISGLKCGKTVRKIIIKNCQPGQIFVHKNT